MRKRVSARRGWLWLAIGVVVIAATLGSLARYGDDEPPAAPVLAVVQAPRGLLYKATAAGFEAELRNPEAADQVTAADAFASASVQARIYRYRAAAREYQRSLRAYATLSASLNAGLMSLNLGEIPLAEEQFRAGLERANAEPGQRRFLTAFQLGLGVVYRQQGRMDESLAAHHAVLKIAGADKDLLAQAAALGYIGNLQAARGLVDEAIAAHEQALELSRQLDHPTGQAVALGNLGHVYAEHGRPDAALDWHRRAYQVAEQRLGSIGQAFALTDIGNAYRMRGQIEDALLSLGRALRFHVELGNTGDRAAAMNDVGHVYFRQGQLDRALAAYEKSFRLYRGIRHAVGQAASISYVGNVYERQRQLDKALAAHEQALELDTASGHAAGRARDLGNIGNVYGRQGRMEEALEHLRTAEAIFQQVRPQGQGAQDVARTIRRLVSPLDLSQLDE